MRKYQTALLALAWLPAFSEAVPPVESSVEVPVAPLAAVTFGPWTNAFRLQNPLFEAVVVPEVGRVMHLACRNRNNLLRVGPLALEVQGREPSARRATGGGIGLWPTRRPPREKQIETRGVPPAALADIPWTGSAWRAEDNSQCCLMTRTFGGPLHIRVSQLVKLDASNRLLSIRQSIERTSASSVPVVLRTLTQFDRPDEIFLPLDAPAAVGSRPFSPREGAVLTRCSNVLVYAVRKAGRRTLGTPSRCGWIAVRRGAMFLVLRAGINGEPGPPPDAGSWIETQLNPKRGYAEIQMQSEEQRLSAGEAMYQTVIFEGLDAEENVSPCERSQRLAEKLGVGKGR